MKTTPKGKLKKKTYDFSVISSSMAERLNGTTINRIMGAAMPEVSVYIGASGESGTLAGYTKSKKAKRTSLITVVQRSN